MYLLANCFVYPANKQNDSDSLVLFIILGPDAATMFSICWLNDISVSSLPETNVYFLNVISDILHLLLCSQIFNQYQFILL